ncbi:MAG: dTMP kinase [Akkermansiaceae bacterium]|jgi:thymidylate kinase
MFISFLGCDGSGKSAVIRGLKERLSANGSEVISGHWRPRAFVKESTEEGLIIADNPHGEAPRGYLSSILKLGWLGLNWWLGWLRIQKKIAKNGYILFDRYHADLLIDPKRYRYGGPMDLARIASCLMPQPTIVFYLDAEPDVLLSRKQEVSKEDLIESRRKYLQLCKTHPRFIVIDANRTIDKVIHDVYQEVKELYL